MIKTGKYIRVNKDCPTCGKSFQSQSSIYCSKPCYTEAQKKYKTCPNCSKQFPSDPNTKYCSVRCYKEARVSRRGRALPDWWKKSLSEGRKKSAKVRGENHYLWKGGNGTQLERNKLYLYKRKSAQKLALNKDFLIRLFAAQGGKCFYCEGDLSKYKAIEHLTPLSRGGDNEPFNIVYACRRCNSSKKDLTLEEFAIRRNKIHLLDKFDIIFADAA